MLQLEDAEYVMRYVANSTDEGTVELYSISATKWRV